MKVLIFITHLFLCNVCIAYFLSPIANCSTPDIKIGSKKFTESVILGEIVTHLTQSVNVHAIHLRELGGTRVLWNALLKGEIDIYPEYTGTISKEILVGDGVHSEGDIRLELIKRGIKMTKALGFNNTYAIGMKEEIAEKLKI
ncbi:MAG: glycine betaine ABC transporter substrate-binding protein, partial [Planctomycetota bacterium]